ncbi:APC family permease [Microbacterium sp. LMI12-1-1.1]|uniref:APC family permease n=1 Tax=Microbacterium sp. LMI12-1-1.1 TaxID=3135225 RepID=UPI00341D1639
MTTVDLVAQSVAAVAPAGVLLTHSGALMNRLGSFAFVALVLASGVIALVALSIAVFARRIAAAGGVYTFVTKGLGPVAGITAGAALAIGYGSVAIDSLRAGVRRLERLLAPGSEMTDAAATAAPDHTVSIALTVVIFALLVAVIIVGARVSTRLMLAIEVLAVSVIIVAAIVVFASTGWNLSPLIPRPGDMPSMSALAGGIGVALLSFVGFESGAALGPESRRPLAGVPRALVWTVGALAAVYLFGVAAQLSAAGSAGTASTLLSGATPGAPVWQATAANWVIVASWLACTLACSNALVRLVFTLAREGVLPSWLGRTSLRFASPHVAAVGVGAALTAGTIAHILSPRGSLLDETIGLASSLCFVIAYLLVCAAVVPYLLRLGEFSVREAWPGLAGAVALVGVTVTEVVGSDVATVTIVCALLGAAAIAHALRLRAGALSPTRVGAYDTPVAADALSTRGELVSHEAAGSAQP